jgi:hypothetical protein
MYIFVNIWTEYSLATFRSNKHDKLAEFLPPDVWQSLRYIRNKRLTGKMQPANDGETSTPSRSGPEGAAAAAKGATKSTRCELCGHESSSTTLGLARHYILAHYSKQFYEVAFNVPLNVFLFAFVPVFLLRWY